MNASFFIDRKTTKMKLLFATKAVIGWVAASLVVVTPPLSPNTFMTTTTTSVVTDYYYNRGGGGASIVMQHQQKPASLLLQEGVATWLADAAAAAKDAPSKQDIQLLREAFAEFYGVDRDLAKAEALLSQAVNVWQKLPADELAGIYRVRGDCYMAQADAAKAVADYDKAVTLLQQPVAAANADPQELPAALLGRARAAKSLAVTTSTTTEKKSWAAKSAKDYEEALKLASREEWDTDTELLEDGATRNPYAAWEWGDALRLLMAYDSNNNKNIAQQAATAHALASAAFDEIGDRARSVIALTDAGIDLAAAASTTTTTTGGTGGDQAVKEAEAILRKAIKKTAGVEGRDVALLQRVIIKEGEGRMALAALLWSDGQRGEAESVLGDACVRLDQLQAQSDAVAMRKGSSSAAVSATATPARLLFSIDDDEHGVGMLCAASSRTHNS